MFITKNRTGGPSGFEYAITIQPGEDNAAGKLQDIADIAVKHGEESVVIDTARRFAREESE